MSDPIVTLNKEQTEKAKAKANKEPWWHRVLRAWDQAFGVTFGGPDDVTMSSDLAVMDREDTGLPQKVGEIGSSVLGYLQHDHGAKAVASDDEFAREAAKEMEDSGIINGAGGQ